MTKIDKRKRGWELIVSKRETKKLRLKLVLDRESTSQYQNPTSRAAQKKPKKKQPKNGDAAALPRTNNSNFRRVHAISKNKNVSAVPGTSNGNHCDQLLVVNAKSNAASTNNNKEIGGVISKSTCLASNIFREHNYCGRIADPFDNEVSSEISFLNFH